MATPLTPQEQTGIVLDSMARYYSLVVTQVQQFANDTKWIEDPESPFALERASLKRKYGPGGSWDESDAKHGFAIAFFHLTSAARYLTGIATLMRERELLCIAPLIRSIFELAARTMWILDPRIDLRDRAARIFLARLEDAKRAKSAAKSLSHPDLVRFGHNVVDLRRTFLNAHFYASEIETDEGGNICLRGQKIPGLKESLRFVDEILGGNWNARGLYDLLSNMVHPTIHAAVENFQFKVDPNGGPARWDLDLTDATYPYRLGRSGVLVFIAMWRLMSMYLGLDVDAIEALAKAIEHVIEP